MNQKETKTIIDQELEIIENDIKDLKGRLDVLYSKKKSLLSKRSAPTYLVGKYIMYKDNVFTTYMRIDKVSDSNLLGEYKAYGASVTITCQLIGLNYTISSESSFHLHNEYKEVTKEKFDEVFDNAIKKIYGEWTI